MTKSVPLRRQIADRRFKIVIFWCLLVAVLICLQPLLKSDLEVIKLFIEKSIWAVGVLLLGISGTDFARAKFGKEDCK